MGALSLAIFIGSLAAVRWILVRMPADYFLRDRRPHDGHNRRWWLWLLGHLLKNLGGVVLVLLGIVMLAGPGQGVLTILIGLSLLDFPGKRQLELHLVRRPKVQEGINWLRRRAGRPPLQIPPAERSEAAPQPTDSDEKTADPAD